MEYHVPLQPTGNGQLDKQCLTKSLHLWARGTTVNNKITLARSMVICEVPESRRLAPDAEKIKRAICKAYGIEESSLLSSRRGVLNEPRNVAIYLVRHLRGEKLEEIGRQFGISKYSSVSSVIEKLKRDMSAERKLRVRVKNIEKILNNSQQQI